MKTVHTPPAAKRASVVLARVSTEELKRGDSVERQIELARAFCTKELAADTSGEIIEIREEAVSGKTFNREGIHRTLALAREGKIRYVTVQDVARFGRKTTEGLHTLDQLVEADVDVKVVTLPWLDYRTNHGRKHWAELLAEAEYERSTYKDKAVAGMWHQAIQGNWKGGHPPYGYACDGKTLVLDQTQAPVMELIFATYAEHGTVMAVVAHFAAKKLLQLPAPTRESTTKPPTLSKRFIDRALRNPIYAGFVPAPSERNEFVRDVVPDLVYHGRHYFKGRHTPLVKATLWKKVQDLLDRPRNRQANHAYHPGSEEYLLQGLMTCGCCGMKFSNGATGKPGGKKIRRYVCRSYVMQGAATSCQNRDLPLAATEKAVIQTLAGLAQHPELITLLASGAGAAKAQSAETARTQIVELEKEQAKMKRQIDNAVTFICENREAALTKKVAARVEKMTQREAEITAELAVLRERIQEAKTALPTEQEIKTAFGRFEELVSRLPRARLKRLIQLLVDEVTASKIVNRADPRYSGLAASSRLVQMKVTLSATGLQFVAQTPSAIVATATPPSGQSRSFGVLPVLFEIRFCGNKGNTVHFIDPAVLESKVVAFADGKTAAPPIVSTLDESHPLFLAQKAHQLQARGTLKKDIARSLGFSAGYVSYLFRILTLDARIMTALLDPESQNLRSWFGIKRLLELVAKKSGEDQLAAFEAQCRLAPLPR
jgi:site-specific DNA recombinase